MDFHMKGGSGKSSYAENSSLQRLIIHKSTHILEESIRELLLCQYHSSGLPKYVKVADLGCSSGPNAFFAIKEIVRSINETCWQLQMDRQPPPIQVFLNDLIGNDFNTLFKMLPNFYDELDKSEGIINIGGRGNNYRSCCYVEGVPGSFYDRLFPDQSIHFFHSSSSLHWLSQVPVGLVSKFGVPLNKKNICVGETSPPSVCEAYANQFKNDFTTFLQMRSREVVPNGHLVLTFLCKNDENDGPNFSEILGNTLQDMVSMGLIEELKQLIDEEGSFTLKRFETFKLKLDANNIDNDQSRGMNVAICIRAVLESLFTNDFDENCINDLFEMYGKNISMYLQEEKGIVNNVTLLLVKRG